MTKWYGISNINLGEGLEDHITLGNSKDIYLSSGFVLKNKLKQNHMKYVVFYYNPKLKELALSFKNQEAKDKFTISYDKRPNKQSAKISCNRMFSAFNIDSERFAGQYSYKPVKDPKLKTLYVVNLKEK